MVYQWNDINSLKSNADTLDYMLYMIYMWFGYALLGGSYAMGSWWIHVIYSPILSSMDKYYIHYKVWGEIIYTCLNFNVETLEVWEWVSNFMPHFIMDVPLKFGNG